ncbi:MAG: isoprenylcysteine carboxylmethyltransferase family protein [Candidatus Dormibacteraceae bacterium]
MRRSRRNERTSASAGAPAAGRYPVMVGLHLALFVSPLVEIAAFGRRPRRTALWIGLLGAAAALRWWSIRSLGSAWNTRGAVPQELLVVTRGPYRWIRHPNYVAVALEFLALPMAGGAWASALLLSGLDLLVLRQRVLEEERRLFAEPRYREVFAHRKRFVPGVW